MPKFIRYLHPEGHVAECHPVRNARLIKFEEDGQEVIAPLFVMKTERGAPLPNGCEWAESEDDFVARIAKRDVPVGATDIEILEAANAL